VPAAAPVQDAAERTEVTVESLTKAYETLLDEHTTLRKLVAKNDSAMRAFKATLVRGLKNAAKKGGRKNRSKDASGEEKPKKETVFNRPVAVSAELTKFLKLSEGTTICRSDVTKRICTYAKEKGLMAGKTINADAPLRKVLGLKDGDSLTILNLQKYLSPHYPKAAVATA
jgi:chromatin remodeling complex protein RSC6